MPRPALSTLLNRWLVIAFIGPILHGCSNLARQPSPTPATSATLLYQLQHWQLRGKLGLRIPQHSGSAYINWQQEANDYRINLSGPLGQGSTLINAEGGKVTLNQSGSEPISAPSAEALMQRTLGWWLPVSDLHYWVKGVASPSVSVEKKTTNSNGSLASLTQNGWQITYQEYQLVPPYQLPSRLHVQRDEIEATLIIKQWQLQP